MLLKDFYTDTSNTSAASNTYNPLYRYYLPANTLNAIGQKITGDFGGKFANNSNVKGIEFMIGLTAVGAGQSVPTTTGWSAKVLIIRTGTTTARVTFTSPLNSDEQDVTGLDFTQPIFLGIYGTGGGAAGDVTAKQGYYQWLPAAP